MLVVQRTIPDQRVLVGVASTLTWQPVDADGEPADPAGTVTVDIVDAEGNTVATGTSTTGTGADAREAALAAQSSLGWLTATWKVDSTARATTHVEIVGGYFFTVAEATARDDKFTDRAKYPTPRILTVRAEVEDEFEQVTKRTWVPRYGRAMVVGSGRDELVLPHRPLRTIRSVTVYDAAGNAGSTFTAGELDELRITDHGTVWSDSGWFAGYTYVLGYEHGYDRPPSDLRDAAITRLRHRLNSHRSGIPDRATSMSTEQGQTFALATPGLRGFVTGIPDVDVALGRYSLDSYGVA